MDTAETEVTLTGQLVGEVISSIETGWIVQYNPNPDSPSIEDTSYLTVEKINHKWDVVHTKDSRRALRMARQEDAEAFRKLHTGMEHYEDGDWYQKRFTIVKLAWPKEEKSDNPLSKPTEDSIVLVEPPWVPVVRDLLKVVLSTDITTIRSISESISAAGSLLYKYKQNETEKMA